MNSWRQPPKKSQRAQVVELNPNRERPDAPCISALGKNGDKPKAYAPPLPGIGNEKGHVSCARAGNARILRNGHYFAILDRRDRFSLVLVRLKDRLLEPIRRDTRGEEAAIETVGR